MAPFLHCSKVRLLSRCRHRNLYAIAASLGGSCILGCGLLLDSSDAVFRDDAPASSVMLAPDGGTELSVRDSSVLQDSSALQDGSGLRDGATTAVPDGGSDGGDQGSIDASRAEGDGSVEGNSRVYSVSGQVDGLSELLELQLDDEKIMLTQSGPFGFEHRLANGESYNLQISTPPPAQICATENAAGTVDGADVEDIRVHCAGDPAGLRGVELSLGTLYPEFDPVETRYRVDVSSWVDHVAVEPLLSHPAASALVEGIDYSDVPIVVNLNIGLTPITIQGPLVMGERQVYTIEVFRLATVGDLSFLASPAPSPGESFGFDIALEGDVLAVGAPAPGSVGSTAPDAGAPPTAPGAGSVYLFERTAASPTLASVLNPSNDAGNGFGRAVAIASGSVVVGSPFDGSGDACGEAADGNDLPAAGAAYVFEWANGTWSQTACLLPNIPSRCDGFGSSIAAEDRWIVIGAPGVRDGASGDTATCAVGQSAMRSGAAYVFERQGATVVQIARLEAANQSAGDGFGASVAISGDVIVIGAPGESSSPDEVEGAQTGSALANSGAAYVFLHDSTSSTWTQVNTLKAPAPRVEQRFGHSVSVDGDSVAVGAPSGPPISATLESMGEDDGGTVYVFERSTGFQLQATLRAANTEPGDRFGSRVALKLDAVAVGAPGEASGNNDQSDNTTARAGAAYLFSRQGDDWVEWAYLRNPWYGDPNDQFGAALGFDGLHLLVGSPQMGVSATGSPTSLPEDTYPAAGGVFLFR